MFPGSKDGYFILATQIFHLLSKPHLKYGHNYHIVKKKKTFSKVNIEIPSSENKRKRIEKKC